MSSGLRYLYICSKVSKLKHILSFFFALEKVEFMAVQGQNVCKLVDALPEGLQRKSILGMRCFYKVVNGYLPKVLSMDDVLLEALICLTPRDQKSVHGLQNCKKVGKEIPSIMAEEQIIVGHEWYRYQEMELMNEDMEGRADHFWNKIFRRTDVSGDKFIILSKRVKCALALLSFRCWCWEITEC